MSEKFGGYEIPGMSTVEIDKDFLLSQAVDGLLIDAKDKGLEIDKSKGNKKQTISSLESSINYLRKMVKDKKMTKEALDSFFDNYLPSAINNTSDECHEFKLRLANGLSTEIQQRMDIQDKE